jgi:hypothetical protein
MESRGDTRVVIGEEVVVAPRDLSQVQVQVVFEEETLLPKTAAQVFQDTGVDITVAGDATVLEAVAASYDMPVESFGRHKVSRPETGQILIREEAVYG